MLAKNKRHLDLLTFEFHTDCFYFKFEFETESFYI